MTDQLPPPAEHDRPFPWRCVECRQKAVVPKETDYTATIKHDGRTYTLRLPNLPIPTCRNCGEQVFTAEEDDRIRAALRAELGLPTPQDIRTNRDARG